MHVTSAAAALANLTTTERHGVDVLPREFARVYRAGTTIVANSLISALAAIGFDRRQRPAVRG